MLRLLRAPDLAFWTVVTIVLAVALGVAAHLGASRDPARPLPGVPAVVDVTASAAAAGVDELVALMPAGIAAGNDPAALRAWAQQVGDVAAAAATVRAGEGATDGDDLLGELGRVVADARSLAGVADEAVAATSWRTRIGLRVSRCALLTGGLPAPQVPDTGPGVVGHRQAPTVPPVQAPATPPVPAVPDTPDPTRVPTVPEE
jgi:hypothetical protein